MTAQFRPLTTRVACIDCQTTFLTVTRLEAHRTCGASHDLCPQTYQDMMESTDRTVYGNA